MLFSCFSVIFYYYHSSYHIIYNIADKTSKQTSKQAIRQQKINTLQNAVAEKRNMCDEQQGTGNRRSSISSKLKGLMALQPTNAWRPFLRTS